MNECKECGDYTGSLYRVLCDQCLENEYKEVAEDE